MSGHSNPNIYLSGHYPTPKAKRLTYLQAARLLITNGWPRNEETLTTALAVMNAESARDPKAYLAYIDLGVDRNSKKGLELRKKIDALPASMTLTTFRHKVRELGAEVVRTDNGLMQIGKTFGAGDDHLTPEYTVGELMSANPNVKKALRLHQSRGFQPWAAYTSPRGDDPEPPYKRYLPYAREAVRKALAEK